MIIDNSKDCKKISIKRIFQQFFDQLLNFFLNYIASFFLFQIASAMVVCTFVSAPLMFVSAKMITITSCNPADYIKQLDAFTLDISIISMVASIWVVAVFILTKKITKIPHKITTCLVISQVSGVKNRLNRTLYKVAH